jgi:hypothetical protein
MVAGHYQNPDGRHHPRPVSEGFAGVELPGRPSFSEGGKRVIQYAEFKVIQ